jgi:hypothetical protein
LTIFHLQGFDTPPYGIISVLRELSWPSGSSIYLLDPLNGQTLDIDAIASDTTPHRFVIINTHEPASHVWFDRLIPDLQSKANISLDHICLRSSCLWIPDSPVAHVGSIVDYVSNAITEYPDCVDIPKRIIQHHFVCFNSQHRWQRLALVLSMLDRGVDVWGKISYLSPVYRDIPSQYRSKFPMILDRASRVSVTWDQGDQIDIPALQGALINVITESSFDSKPGTIKPETHHLPGLTEKTFKSILLGQLPIWLAPVHTVQCYRDLGFDAFDDIVNHEYDTEPNPEKRIQKVADEILRLCNAFSKPNLQTMFDKNRSRFQKNLDVFRSWNHNHARDLPKWQKWSSRWKRLNFE